MRNLDMSVVGRVGDAKVQSEDEAKSGRKERRVGGERSSGNGVRELCAVVAKDVGLVRTEEFVDGGREQAANGGRMNVSGDGNQLDDIPDLLSLSSLLSLGPRLCMYPPGFVIGVLPRKPIRYN